MSNQPREIFPITLFANRPRLGAISQVDFRPKAVPVDDALPPTAPPPVMVEEKPAPKAESSATDSAMQSEIGTDETVTPTQSPSLSPTVDNPVSAEKVTQRVVTPTPENGGSMPPAETTGQVAPIVRPPIGTPSSPGEAKP